MCSEPVDTSRAACPATGEGRGDTARGPSWARLVGPLVLLCVEVAALTPFAEFTAGPMQFLADARLCSGLLFAAVAFFLLAGGRLRRDQAGEVGSRLRGAVWLAVNLGLYAALFWVTLRLTANGGRGTPLWAAGVWGLLAAGVGLSAALVFLRPRILGTWLGRYHLEILVALGLGAALVPAASLARKLWTRLDGPAVALDRQLLEWTYGEGLLGRTPDGCPVVGTRRLLVKVTPQCAELETIPAFWLLGVGLLCGRWRAVGKVRWVVVLVLGTVGLYLLNAVRLFGLVVLGIQASPEVCVSLAHSRVGGICLVGIALVFLSFSLRPRRSRLSTPLFA
jgi:exosortase/archaeosortase family protein